MNRIIHKILLTEFSRRIEIQMLMHLVTSSLHVSGPFLLFTHSAQSLNVFATFTAEHLVSISQEQKQQLHAKAFSLGKRMRKCLTKCDNETLTSLTFLLYRNIGIRMKGTFPGKVIITQCYFCHYYSLHICHIASLMDDGVISGLYGGGRLEFSEKITEGKPHCCCKLTAPK